MKKKNGFVFVETIVVLTVTMVILLTLYNSYVVILKNIQSRLYFNNMNDIYKAHIVKKMFKNDQGKYNYSKQEKTPIIYVPENPDSTKYEYICNRNHKAMRDDCTEVLKSLGISYVVLLPEDFNKIDFTAKSYGFYKMSFQKFLGTLDEKQKIGNSVQKIGHIVVVMIDENGKYHYASIRA